MNKHIMNAAIIASCAIAALLCGVVGWALPAGLFGSATGIYAITVYLTEVRR